MSEVSDDLYERAKVVAKEKKYVSTSLLHRRLQISYAWAYRIVDRMEDEKFCEPFNPRRPRRILPNPTNLIGKDE